MPRLDRPDRSFITVVHTNIPRHHNAMRIVLLLQDNLLAVCIGRHGIHILSRIVRRSPARPGPLDIGDDVVLAPDGRAAVLGAQLELVGVALVGGPPPVRVLAADSLDAHRGAAAAAAVGRARVRVAGRAVDLEEAADEGLEEGGAGGNDADVELEAVWEDRC